MVANGLDAFYCIPCIQVVSDRQCLDTRWGRGLTAFGNGACRVGGPIVRTSVYVLREPCLSFPLDDVREKQT